jgi:putative ABC transport system permease protein
MLMHTPGWIAHGALVEAGDADPQETQEWLDALEGVVRAAGHERGLFLLKQLEARAQQMGIVTLFNTGFAALIVLGVVYNSARISLSEQARDLASMRVLGFRRGETAFVLLGELGLLILLSLPIGILMGIWLSRYVTERFCADLYTIPFGIHASTLAEGVLVVMAAALATALLIRIRVDDLDLVQALKTRE